VPSTPSDGPLIARGAWGEEGALRRSRGARNQLQCFMMPAAGWAMCKLADDAVQESSRCVTWLHTYDSAVTVPEPGSGRSC